MSKSFRMLGTDESPQLTLGHDGGRGKGKAMMFLGNQQEVEEETDTEEVTGLWWHDSSHKRKWKIHRQKKKSNSNFAKIPAESESLLCRQSQEKIDSSYDKESPKDITESSHRRASRNEK